jgi:hypothetical protein
MPFTARYPGKCSRTGSAINPGDTVQSVGRGRYALVSQSRPVSDSDLIRELDPELYDSDPDAAESAGRYLRQATARGVSNIWTSGGREYYRNRSGICEDAPCCGCCNA